MNRISLAPEVITALRNFDVIYLYPHRQFGCVDDPDITQLAEHLERLEGEVERIEERQDTGRNTLELQSHDLRVKATSEDCDMQTLAVILSGELEEMSRRALIGEYQQLEQENMFMELFDQ